MKAIHSLIGIGAALVGMIVLINVLFNAWYRFNWPLSVRILPRVSISISFPVFCILLVIGILLLILLIRAVFRAEWTGFGKRDLWDWMDEALKIIGAFAIALTVIGLIVNVNQFNAQQLASAAQSLDQKRQTTLDTYFDRMQELLLAKPDDFKSSEAPCLCEPEKRMKMG